MHMGLRSALFGSALPLAGFELGMDFRAGWYRSGAVVTRDPAAMPGVSFVRPGAKFEDVGGGLVPVAGNAPAIIPGVGFIARPGYTNAIANSAFAGAVAGNPGSGPTKMQIATVPVGNGLSRQVAATGTDPATGIPYIDYRFFGTANAAVIVYPMLSHAAATEAPVSAAGDIWTASLGFVLLPGAVLGTARISLTFDSRNDDGSTIGSSNSVTLVTDGVIVANPPRVSKVSAVVPATNGVRMWMFLSISLRQGETYDFTMRLSAPSLVKSPIVGPYIPTTNGPVTIVDDDMRITGPVPDDGDWVGIVSATLPDAASSPAASPIGLVFIGNPAGGGNFIYVGRQPSGASGGIFVTASSGGTNVATVNSNLSHVAGGRHVIAFGRRASRYFIMARNAAGSVSAMTVMPSDQPMPVGLGRIQPGRRDVAGQAINGPLEFFGWRRGTFTDDQVRGMLVALA